MKPDTEIVTVEIKSGKTNHEDIGNIIIFSSSGLLLVLVILVGGALATGIITGLMSAMGFGFLLFRLRASKPEMWNWVIDNPGKMDVLMSMGFICLLAPATATGIIAGASAALFASAGISAATKFIGKVPNVGPINWRKDLSEAKLAFSSR